MTDSQRFAPYAWDIETEVNRYPEQTEHVMTVPAHVRASVEKFKTQYPDRQALILDEENIWGYTEYLAEIEKTALAFINLGLGPLQGVGIIGFNSPEWIFSFFGSMFAGGFAVGIYSTNNAGACVHVINDAKCPIIVAQDKKQSEKVLSKIKDMPHIKAIVQYQGSVDDLKSAHADRPDLKIMTWSEMMEQHASDYSAEPQAVLDREAQVSPYRCCTLVYTSGTTGNPKGAILTHANYMSMLNAVLIAGKSCWLKNEDLKVITYLPLSHIMAQITDIGTTFTLGGSLVFAKPDALKGSLATTIAEHRPSVLIGVPRVYEKIQAGVEQTLMKQYGMVRWSIRKCLERVLLANECAMMGMPEPWGTAPARSVINSLKRKIGLDEVVYAISGGAPLLEDTQRFWLKLDMPICQGYGLSEVSGAHVAQCPIMGVEDMKDFVVGSAGTVLQPNYKIKIDPETDEVLLAGQNVFSGYLNREDATKECLVETDGEWYFKTGDMGQISEKGQLFITGRLKELIITAGGENVPPVPIEECIKAGCEDLISNVLVVGDRRKFLSCFVTLKCVFKSDENGQEWPTDDLPNWTKRCLERAGISGITTVSAAKNDERIRKMVEASIKNYNDTEATSSAQKVQKFEILDQDFSIAAGDLGPTLKLKRNVVVDKLKEEIDKFYPQD